MHNLSNRAWDVAIIGSGFGGSMAAYRLAKTGLSVLVLERGDWVQRDASAWDATQILIERKYRDTTPYEASGWPGRSLVYPDVAVGGNSVFYGAASLRMRKGDFFAAQAFDGDLQSNLSFVDWPFGYDTLAPYYDEAEKLLDVAGVAGIDPFEPPRAGDYPQAPPPYSIPAARLAQAAEALGLRPFPLPLAINYRRNAPRPSCVRCTTCDLFPCKICAKNDLSVTILPRAIRAGAVVRANTVATEIQVEGNRVRRISCVDVASGERFSIRAALCIAACGAIGSARLLLLSGLGARRPNGALIGRYLLRHCNGIVIGMFPFTTNPHNEFNKQVAITDFYYGHPEGKGLPGPWGMIQALQVPPPEYIVSQAPFPIGAIGGATTKYHAYLLCIAEDLPDPENRVTLHPVRRDVFGLPIASVHSRYARRDLQARRALYREAAKILRQAGAVVRVRKPINTYSHAIGTCRFGHSPEMAVLDPNCNFFGVKNLFVVDGSFMPSSGSVNPSLTIAANALRVADYLSKNWQQHVGARKKRIKERRAG